MCLPILYVCYSIARRLFIKCFFIDTFVVVCVIFQAPVAVVNAFYILHISHLLQFFLFFICLFPLVLDHFVDIVVFLIVLLFMWC